MVLASTRDEDAGLLFWGEEEGGFLRKKKKKKKGIVWEVFVCGLGSACWTGCVLRRFAWSTG